MTPRSLGRDSGLPEVDAGTVHEVLVGDGDAALATLLAERIHAFNEETTDIRDGRLLDARVLDDDGELVGAAVGWTFGGCGYVEVLWVRGDARHGGVGTALMDAVEAEALARGCTQVALSSHSFQAPRFYEARGYVEVGRTPDYPRGHDQVHLLKRFSSSPAS